MLSNIAEHSIESTRVFMMAYSALGSYSVNIKDDMGYSPGDIAERWRQRPRDVRYNPAKLELLCLICIF